MGSWISRAKKVMAEKKPPLTQSDIAPSMGKTTRGAIGHYFTGRSKPTLDQLEGLSKFLGVSLSWLVSDHGENTAVDDDTLEECLKLVEEAEAEANVLLTPTQAAKMTTYLYRAAKDGQEINDKRAAELITLVTS